MFTLRMTALGATVVLALSLVAGCGSNGSFQTSGGPGSSSKAGQAVKLARDYVSGPIVHKAGEVILLSRIEDGHVGRDVGCTDTTGNQLDHFHSNDVGKGIYIDGKGPFLESQPEHDTCGYGLIVTGQ